MNPTGIYSAGIIYHHVFLDIIHVVFSAIGLILAMFFFAMLGMSYFYHRKTGMFE